MCAPVTRSVQESKILYKDYYTIIIIKLVIIPYLYIALISFSVYQKYSCLQVTFLLSYFPIHAGAGLFIKYV